MRTVWYETEWKRSRIGDPPHACRAVAAGRQRCRRGRGTRWCFSVFGKAVASGRRERRSGGVSSQAASRPHAPLECQAEAATGKDSLGRTAEGRVPQRLVDLPPGGRSDCQEVRGRVSPRSRVEDSPQLGLDLSEAGAAGTRTRRSGHPPVARSTVAGDKKGAKRRRLPPVFLDESGFMLQPVRRRTWAPSGQTPIQAAWDRHDRLSVIGLLNVSPSRQRLSLFFQVLWENVATDHMVWFLHQLHDYHHRN